MNILPSIVEGCMYGEMYGQMVGGYPVNLLHPESSSPMIGGGGSNSSPLHNLVVPIGLVCDLSLIHI